MCGGPHRTVLAHLGESCQGGSDSKGRNGAGGGQGLAEGPEGGGGEESVDEVAAVGYPDGHVDAVGQDEPDAAEHSREEEGGEEEDGGKQEHAKIKPEQGEIRWSV